MLILSQNIFLVYFLIAMQKNFFSHVTSGVEGYSYIPTPEHEVLPEVQKTVGRGVYSSVRGHVYMKPKVETQPVLPIDEGTDICDKDGFCN
jgi:hypothetical protein